MKTREFTKQELQTFLLRAMEGDKERVKLLAKSCQIIGFPLGEHVNDILEAEGTRVSIRPEFVLLITYSDLGILGKLTESLERLKNG